MTVSSKGAENRDSADGLYAVVEKTPQGDWTAVLYDENNRQFERPVPHPFSPAMPFSFRWTARRVARRALRYRRKELRGLHREVIR